MAWYAAAGCRQMRSDGFPASLASSSWGTLPQLRYKYCPDELGRAYESAQFPFFGERSRSPRQRLYRLARAAADVRRLLHAKRPFTEPAAVLAYLSQYIHRVAISNQRLVALNEQADIFCCKDCRGKDLSKDDDGRAVQVYAPVPAACRARWISPHLSQRAACQCWAQGDLARLRAFLLCEVCWQMAYRRKRRNPTGPADIRRSMLWCGDAHHRVQLKPRSDGQLQLDDLKVWSQHFCLRAKRCCLARAAGTLNRSVILGSASAPIVHTFRCKSHAFDDNGCPGSFEFRFEKAA
jgi:hypothetical protein